MSGHRAPTALLNRCNLTVQTAWQFVRRNGGAAGVDDETVQRVVERWLGELARDLKAGTYRPSAVRQVMIPKKQAGKHRPLGIPSLRDRVAQPAALMVLTPIFEADGGVVGVPRIPHWTQLPPDHGACLHRHPAGPEQRSGVCRRISELTQRRYGLLVLDPTLSR